MRVGVIGWYGQGNAGDDRMLSVIRSALGEHHLLVTTAFREVADRIDELNACDAVILGGGGLVMRSTAHHAGMLRLIRPPLVCLGLSVESTHPDTEAMRKIIAESARLIVVRDSRSARAFPGRCDVVVAPDITFLEPLDVVSPSPHSVCAVNLRPWHQWPGEPGGWLSRTMGRLQTRHRRLSAWMPVPRWSPQALLSAVGSHLGELRPLPLCTNANQDDRAELATVFARVPTDWSPALLRGCRYVIGMRLHSLVFACQSGLPFVSLSYQPKCVEFCRSVGLPELSVALYGLRGLGRALHTITTDYDAIRDRLVDYRARAKDAVAQAMDLVRDAI